MLNNARGEALMFTTKQAYECFC